MTDTLAEQFLDEIGYNKAAYNSVERFSMRIEHIHTFGFGHLTSDIVETLKELGPLVEVGAGSGYWTAELQDAGIDIIATNPNEFSYSDSWREEWCEIERISALSAVEKYPERNVLMVWPCMDDWGADVLNSVKNQTVIYIGESQNGCTASDKFFDIIDAEFQVEIHSIRSLTGVYDNMYVLNRV